MKSLYLIALSLFCLPIYSQIEVSEINYNSDSTVNSGNWVELHNTGTSTIDLTSWLLTDANPFNIFNFSVGKSIPAGGFLVVVSDTVKFKSVHPAITNFIGEMNFGLSNNSDTITIYDASGTIVYNTAYFDSTPWQKTADGMGRTLELRTTGANPAIPESWFAGCIGGSPGVAYTPCNAPIVVSEINYNSVVQINSGDWIEFHNRTSSPIDLSSWEVKDKEDTNVFVFPAGSILAANGYLVVVYDSVFFKNTFPGVINFVGEMGFNIANSGDGIRLFNAQTGKIQFSMVYDNKAPWPVGANGQGYTLELIDDNGIVNDGSNWRDGCLGGSPGRAYDPACGTGIFNIQKGSFDLELLNSGSGGLLFSSTEFEAGDAKLEIFDMSGTVVCSLFPKGKTQPMSCELPAGVYVAKAQRASGYSVVKFTWN